jgi:hypothetical protein
MVSMASTVSIARAESEYGECRASVVNVVSMVRMNSPVIILW